jgi:hypothetical protein
MVLMFVFVDSHIMLASVVSVPAIGILLERALPARVIHAMSICLDSFFLPLPMAPGLSIGSA